MVISVATVVNAAANMGANARTGEPKLHTVNSRFFCTSVPNWLVCLCLSNIGSASDIYRGCKMHDVKVNFYSSCFLCPAMHVC